MSKIDIAELAKHCPDVTISIKIGDLMEANKQLVEDLRISLEKQIRDEHEERYLSSDDVCDMLNVSKPTLWRWEKIDYLIPIRVGGKVRYKLSEVKQILDDKKGGQK
ncbi:MAG: helix-turn-helix domain-containing protein [Bacteroidales bacterium]|nr:helix-turn-helix domain-containing protein [Bacteroidales bacterium]